ncbi:MAG: CRTAC1 family protein [Gemmatimonadota bacterium]
MSGRLSARARRLAGALAATLVARMGAAEGPRFVDVTAAAGIDFVYTDGATGRKYMPETMGSGAAFFDYDGDGELDLYVVNGAPLPGFQAPTPPTNALYRNRGDGTFADSTAAAGVGDTGYGMGAAVGDCDNDGDADLYVTNFGANVLYRNQGDGRFAADAGAGVADPGWGTSAAFADYDRDGDLDLYVANYMDYDPAANKTCYQGAARAYCGPTAYPGQSGVMYRNEGGGRFLDVTRTAGLYTDQGRQLGIVFGDEDDDGAPDLFVANDKRPNFLFRNNGDGTFTDLALTAGVAYNAEGEPESAMGADLADYDNDGRLDIVVATFQWLANTLYHNDGAGFYTDVTFQAGVGTESLPYLGMTAAFLDYDNDGFLDLFVANGHLDSNVKDYDPAASYEQRNQLFQNRRDGTFCEVTGSAGPAFAVARVSHGAAFGDYDRDGDTDIFVSDSNGKPSQLMRNDGGSDNHYLAVRTRGTASNRDGIGTRLELVAGDLRQVREVRSGYGYMGASDVRALFGLGHRRQVERLTLRWPSGRRQTLRNLAADQELTITEPDN